MKFKNLFFSLLIISSSLNINANINATEKEAFDYVIESFDEEPEADTQECDTQIVKQKSIKDSLNEASLQMAFDAIATVSDLKDFSEKHPHFIAGLSIIALIATYKLIR